MLHLLKPKLYLNSSKILKPFCRLNSQLTINHNLPKIEPLPKVFSSTFGKIPLFEHRSYHLGNTGYLDGVEESDFESNYSIAQSVDKYGRQYVAFSSSIIKESAKKYPWEKCWVIFQRYSIGPNIWVCANPPAMIMKDLSYNPIIIDEKDQPNPLLQDCFTPLDI